LVAQAGGPNCETISVDLTSPLAWDQIAAVLETGSGPWEVLVNAAGYASCTPFGELTAEEFAETWNVNVLSVFRLTQLLWRKMQQQRSGTIVNVSSLAAVDPFPGFSAYGSSKAWVDLFTKALAKEGREWGIRAFSVRPGAVETPMLRGLFPDFPTDQTVSPDEVAEVICDLLRPGFQFSSGQAWGVTRQRRSVGPVAVRSGGL
jgi:NAD(P)-dependent dehydrogenase (short-subunit alcohol dehydrogenase family)